MGVYRMMRRLSPEGAFLDTFAGRPLNTDLSVFLKRLPSFAPITCAGALVENMRALQSAAMPALVEVGTAENQLWVVTEGTEGASLRWVMSTLAKATSFIAPREGLSVVARVATILKGLHQQRTTHGDVCPATIYVTSQGAVQLHDGGIAATLGTQAEFGPCRSELNSLAPEHLQSVNTPETDVFQLGLVLYELSVGRPLWSGTPAKVSQAASGWTGLAPQKVKQVPEPWCWLLRIMLSADPSVRPSMEDVVSVIEKEMTPEQQASDDDISALFARANQGRPSVFLDEESDADELHVSPFVSSNSPKPFGAVVARIATRKVRKEPEPQPQLEAIQENLTDESLASLETRVSKLLIDRGQVASEQVAAARESLDTLGGLGKFLLDAGAVTEDALVAATGELTRTPSVTADKLAEATPSEEALGLIPLSLSRLARSVPLGLKGGKQLLVAMADPMDAEALGHLKAALGGTKSLIAFRAGARALASARARLYPGAEEPASPTPQVDQGPLVPALACGVIDSLLGLLGPRGAQAQRLVGVTKGLAKRMGLSETERGQVELAAQSLVSGALLLGRLPYQIPSVAELQERCTFGADAAKYAAALHGYPATFPDQPALQVLVVAFTFASHAGEPKPSGKRLTGALNVFRACNPQFQPLMDCLTAELET